MFARAQVRMQDSCMHVRKEKNLDIKKIVC